MNFTYSGNGNPSSGSSNEEIFIDNVTEPLLLTVIGSGMFRITASWDSLSLNSSSAESSDGPMMVTSTDQAVGEDGYIIFEDIGTGL